MIQNIRKERGVTMITVSIAIIILIIITGILVYNARDMIYIKNYNALKNDIELLRSKVSDYYNEYGTIPVKGKCLFLSDGVKTVFNEVEKNQEENFYVLDLEALDGLSLNYGKDYEIVKNSGDIEDYYSDLYIVHLTTHNIFLNGGIQFRDGDTVKYYYTDYEKPDENKVDYRYIDGIKIPDGYYYIGRSDINNIVISTSIDDEINLQNENQYYWNSTDEILEDAVLEEGQTEEEYKQSTLENNGYYVNDTTKKVIYLDTVIQNIDDTSPYLPDSNSVMLEGTSLETGLVAIDSNDNEWVWIVVPRSIYKNPAYNDGIEPENSEDYEKIENVLKNYTVNYRGDYEDEFYEGCGIATKEEYDNLKNKMLKSVYENGGFWIGRYEAGAETTVSSDDNGARGMKIQKDLYPYNYVRESTAQELSSNLAVDQERTSSLLFGVQWDLILKYIETSNVTTNDGTDELITEYLIKSDSTKWGNYINAEFVVTSDNAKVSASGSNYTDFKKGWKKNKGTYSFLTTGASDRNCILNIYDLAGNFYEWTLEKSFQDALPCTDRGGCSFYAGYQNYADHHFSRRIDQSESYISFRSALY